MMKKEISKYFIIALLLSISLYAGASLVYFHVQSDGNKVILEWQTNTENDLKEFKILRKTLNSQFTELAVVSAKGSYSTYKYEDKSAYKSSDNVYTYKLEFINTSGNSDGLSSEEPSVAHNVSSVKRTWGSIKALFR